MTPRMLRLVPSREGSSSPVQPADDFAGLLDGLRARRPDATTLAWRRFAPVVRGTLRRSLGPDADVEDLVQDTFVIFFRRAVHVEHSEALLTYVLTLTVSVLRRELRRRKARSWLLLTATGRMPEHAAEPSMDVDARGALRRFYAALDVLAANERAAFVLRFIEGYKLEEVAAALGVSLATAKRKIARAEERLLRGIAKDPVLRAYLESQGASDGD